MVGRKVEIRPEQTFIEKERGMGLSLSPGVGCVGTLRKQRAGEKRRERGRGIGGRGGMDKDLNLTCAYGIEGSFTRWRSQVFTPGSACPVQAWHWT